METLTDRVAQFLREHNRWFVAACGFLLVISALLWGYQRYTLRQNEEVAYAYHKVLEGWEMGSDRKDLNLEDLDRSLSDFIKNYSSHPLSTLAEFDRLALMAEQGRWASVKELGLELLKKIPAENPLYPILLRHIALAHEKLGEYDSAVKFWELLAGTAPSLWHRDTFWHLGRVLAASGNESEAEKYLKKALEADGGFPADFMIKAELDRIQTEPLKKEQK